MREREPPAKGLNWLHKGASTWGAFPSRMGKSKLAVRINPAGESIPDFLPQICFLSSQASVFKYHLAGYLQHRAQNQQLLSLVVSPLARTSVMEQRRCRNRSSYQAEAELSQGPPELTSTAAACQHTAPARALGLQHAESLLMLISARRVCQEQGLCLILLVLTFTQENFTSQC